jgi:hypothetical protein
MWGKAALAWYVSRGIAGAYKYLEWSKYRFDILWQFPSSCTSVLCSRSYRRAKSTCFYHSTESIASTKPDPTEATGGTTRSQAAGVTKAKSTKKEAPTAKIASLKNAPVEKIPVPARSSESAQPAQLQRDGAEASSKLEYKDLNYGNFAQHANHP